MDEQALSRTRWIWRPGATTLLTIACALAQASFGYDSTIGPVAPDEVTSTFDFDIPLSYGAAQFGGGFTITFGVASVVGAILTIFLGEPLGRKRSVAIGAATALLGALFQVAAKNPIVFSTGRVLSGLGCGFNSASAPVWQVEATETRLRGRLILLQLIAKAVGSLVAGWVTLAYSTQYLYSPGDTEDIDWHQLKNPVSWRLPIGMQILPIVLLLLLIPQLPESPRWLLGKGRINEATETVSQLLCRRADDPSVQLFLLELSNSSEYGHETPFQILKKILSTCCCQRPKPGIPFRRVKRWRRLGFGSALQFFAQWSGYAAFQLSFTRISRFSLRTNKILQYSSLTWYAICAVLSIVLVEKLGRRRSLLTAFLGQAFCGVILTGLLSETLPSTKIRYACLVFSGLGQSFCGFNYGLPWLYQLEVNAWSLRLIGIAVAQVIQYLGSVTLVYGWSFTTDDTRMLFIAPIIISALAASMIFLFCPETTGRTPQDLDNYYSNAPSAWVWKQADATCVRVRSSEESILAHVSEPRELGVSTKGVVTVNISSSEETIATSTKSLTVVK